MASGKSTLGRALAKRLGTDFIDLDFYITQRYRTSIPQIFAQKGEAAFRRLEMRMLREVGEFTDIVISCGGGTPCHSDNIDYMNSAGITVMLEASEDCIIKRLLSAKSRRPIVEGKSEQELRSFIHNHLQSRLPYYRRASLTVNSEQLESREGIDATVEAVLEKLKKL